MRINKEIYERELEEKPSLNYEFSLNLEFTINENKDPTLVKDDILYFLEEYLKKFPFKIKVEEKRD
jgi:hypothetical protein